MFEDFQNSKYNSSDDLEMASASLIQNSFLNVISLEGTRRMQKFNSNESPVYIKNFWKIYKKQEIQVEGGSVSFENWNCCFLPLLYWKEVTLGDFAASMFKIKRKMF